MPCTPRNPNWRHDLVGQLQQGRSLSLACALANVSAQTVKNHRNKDPDFDDQVKALLRPQAGRKKQGWQPWMIHYIELLASGYTLNGAAAKLGKGYSSVVDARQRYPDFAAAIDRIRHQQPGQQVKTKALTSEQQDLLAFTNTSGYDLLLQSLRSALDKEHFSTAVAAIRAALGE